MSSIFLSYLVCSGNKVRIVEGSYSSIAGKCDFVACHFLHLSSVFHVPNFFINLLSISQITKSLNSSVTFLPSHCVFQDLETRRTIGRGFENDGLYLLNTSSMVVSPVQ